MHPDYVPPKKKSIYSEFIQKVVQFKTSDGCKFDTEEQAIEHERKDNQKKCIYNYLRSALDYNSRTPFSLSDFVDLIVDDFDTFLAILNSTKD
jgi:hypothetical protein